MKRSVYGSVFDLNGSSLPNVINDEGFGGNAFLIPSYVVYYWQLSISDYASRRIKNDE